MQPADGPADRVPPLDLARAAPALIVGAVTVDVVGGDRLPGGAVSYAARTAAALGLPAYILTTAAPDADLGALEGHAASTLESLRTLMYEHMYDTGDRRMRLLARPDRALAPSDVPLDWPRPRTLVLGPLLPDDVDVAGFLHAYGPAEVALLAQGLQRRIDAHGDVHDLDAPSAALLAAARPHVSVFLSAEETRGWPAGALDDLAGRVRRVVLTHGAEGAEVRAGSRVVRVPAVPATAVDTTGAGDVFATAFILAVGAGADDARAGRLAAACAAANVEQRGPAPLPERATLEARAAAAADGREAYGTDGTVQDDPRARGEREAQEGRP